MKKSLLAVGVLSAFAGAASAQSSVTLSGSVDVGVQRIDGDYTMGTAASSRSNLTFSGVEDLGGGLKAMFLLNHRFNPDEGTINPGGNAGPAGTTQFWRNAWVGLGGGFGDIRLGRILMPLQDLNGNYEAWAGGDTVATVHTGGVSATNRANNAIYYRTPSWGGLTLHAAIAAGDNQTPVASAERPLGFGAKFDAGAFSAALAWDRTASDLKTYGVYGKYDFGRFALMGQFESGEKVTDGDDFDRWSISGKLPIGAATLKAGYTDYKDEDQSKFGIGVDYALSKRTALYSDIGKQRGDGFTDVQKKARFDVGVWHKF